MHAIDREDFEQQMIRDDHERYQDMPTMPEQPREERAEDWTMQEDYLLGWSTRTWEYGIFDNPNGPYLRYRFLGPGREVRPSVDPQTSEILRLRQELDEERSRIRRQLKEAFAECFSTERDLNAEKVINALDRVCSGEE